GFVFAAIRYGLALMPRVALRVPAKKIAALVALAAGVFYLLLSGGNVATERAFVMVAVMLGAVLFDRRALSLRSVAIAATILLISQPETMMEPGFQMSFAATVALVAGFGALRGRMQPHRMPRWGAAVFTLVFSSLLAGFATAPIAAAHFNRVAGYGLIANLMAVPVMGTAVMPAAVMAAVLAPLGLEAPALWVMEQGTRWILWVAGFVAGLDGAVRAVPSPAPWVLPLLGFGALWTLLWRGPVRFVGAAPVVAAFAIWSMAQRPPVLISGDGGLVGLRGGGARALSADKGGGFTALQWLENDGDLADQAGAAARPGFDGPKAARRFEVAGWRGVQIKGKGAEAALPGACAVADLVITTAKVSVAPPGCQVIDAGVLAQTGALAIWPQPDGSLILEPTQQAVRLWSAGLRISHIRTAPPMTIRRSAVLTARTP
ncbi:MAG: ComEC/Rec2 family competence protein, partial [Paracoccaceae bacterium]|nr:ComEC/Rec2 family competence protein [Paracoccaceae bacterium]